MNRKIVGILVMTLLIATAVLPVVGTMNYVNNLNVSSALSTVEWSMTYGEDRFEMLQCVQTTSDGGYIACGVKSAYDLDDVYRPWVLKVDSSGNKEWEWYPEEIEFEGDYYNYFDECTCFFVKQTNDGGYITGFKVMANTELEEFWLSSIVKLYESGEVEWIENCMDGFDWCFSPISVIELEDGSFLITGFSGTTKIGDLEDDVCLYKIDSMGVEQWCKEYSYGVSDVTFALCETNDNGYLVTGWADNAENLSDFWMIKTDSNGNKIWEKIYGGSNQDFGHARNCYQTSDGGYIMSGYTYSYGNGQADVWIVKTDSMGNMEWNRTYGGSAKDVCWSFESLNDDTYVFCVTYNFNSFSKADIHLPILLIKSHCHLFYTMHRLHLPHHNHILVAIVLAPLNLFYISMLDRRNHQLLL